MAISRDNQMFYFESLLKPILTRLVVILVLMFCLAKVKILYQWLRTIASCRLRYICDQREGIISVCTQSYILIIYLKIGHFDTRAYNLPRVYKNGIVDRIVTF